MTLHLRIGARPSALALAQARLVKDALSSEVHGLVADIVPIRTSGDRMQAASLARVGGKGLFVRELEQALSEHRIDIAVHSMKDLPATLPSHYRLAAVSSRENPHDALIVRAGHGWESLSAGARLGTSSVRRRLEVLHQRPDLTVLPLRGNVDTRLQRLQQGDFDAIILAISGLRRLGRAEELQFTELEDNNFVPSGGQGALAIEALCDWPPAGSPEIEQAVSAINHPPSQAEVSAERAFLAAIGASCVSPVGVLGTMRNGTLRLRALLFSQDGARSLSAELSQISGPAPARGPISPDLERMAADLGMRLGQQMLDNGADELLSGE